MTTTAAPTPSAYTPPSGRSLRALCTPRKSVFDADRRDVVLDITDLIDDRIRADEFFEENYLTAGMHTLLEKAMSRFSRQPGAPGVFVLTQAMGGGKTHNMIALGLLAKHPEIRERVLGGAAPKGLGRVRVVGFTGRESDYPLGVWGAIADQLGKKEAFKDYYSPLQAPGQTAWVNLLKGEPLLILLDELPPYFENARAKTIGSADLATVTTTALSNLLVAVGKQELENVCVVISDLRATYGHGSTSVQTALANFENEVARGSVHLEPVGSNSSEIYHILRKRLFATLPEEAVIADVAKEYAQAVRDAKQMDVVSASPEQFATELRESYPFHFSMRDLYARFRENPGFQQTRGLIRIMRTLVASMWKPGGRAEQVQLIHPYDFDLNDRQTLADITQINPQLDNAVAHDIASNGSAIAERMDAKLGGTDAQDAAKLILVASLANVPNAVLGLSIPETILYLCAPGRDVARLTEQVLKPLAANAWYLHANKEGKLYFKNVQNLVAKLTSHAKSYNRESNLRELREQLVERFRPQIRDCYQEVAALPAVDQIELKPDRVTLVLFEPHDGGGLHPDLKAFYEASGYKNRVAFLSGARRTVERLLEIAAECKAIAQILKDLRAEKVPESDPQWIQADEIRDQKALGLLSAARETFTTLYYPHGGSGELMTAEFLMQFSGNAFDGEKQVRDVLKAKQKFTEDVSSETFRKKAEQRLFGTQQMLWSEVKARAARTTSWQWHRPDALDRLKDDLVAKDQWREEGGYVDKGPFPQPKTDVRVAELSRDDDTGRVTLRLSAIHGDAIHYEIGGPATPASARVQDPQKFVTDELVVSFLCVDSKGTHETGNQVVWRNRITVKSRQYDGSNGSKMVELRAAPTATIRYTTDGSNPRTAGGTYDEPFAVPAGTRMVLAVAERAALSSDEHRLDITWGAQNDWKVDPAKPATWKRAHKVATTKEVYELLGLVRKHGAKVLGARALVQGTPHWLDVNFDDQLALTSEQLEAAFASLRTLVPGDVQLELQSQRLVFDAGQRLLDWAEDARTELKQHEVAQ